MATIDPTTPLNLAEVMATMLSALIEAQARAARTTVEFIKDVGLKERDKDQPEQIRTIQFSYKKLDENQTLSDFVAEIPLLGLVDIPMISIKKAIFSFGFDITHTEPGKIEETKNQSKSGTFPVLSKSAVLEGRFMKKSRGVSEFPSSKIQEQKASLDITIEIEKPGIPSGLDRILDILELSSSETRFSEGERSG